MNECLSGLNYPFNLICVYFKYDFTRNSVVHIKRTEWRLTKQLVSVTKTQ